MTLREHISLARKNKTAIGHFNVSTLDGIWAVVDAAAALKVPVIVGMSEGERDYVGVKQAAAIIRSIREERDQDIYLNADHTYSFDRVKEAIDAGFDAVIIDGAQLKLDENITLTKRCVEYAKRMIETTGRDILVEGEIGYIGTSSKVLDAIPADVAVSKEQMTKPADALDFVRQTGVDLLAPAVGNIHGMITGGDPTLNVDLIQEISRTVNVPLVLHGASGNTPSDIAQSIANGVQIVHVNTELRLAYRTGLMKSLSENHDEIAPYKYLKPAKLSMQKVVEDKLKLYS